MGNSPPYVVQLGNFASINFLEGQANGEHYEMRSVSFRAEERIAEVSIKVLKGPDKRPNGKFLISITDSDKANAFSLRSWPYRFEMMVEKEEGNHVKVNYAKTKIVHDKDHMIWLATLARVGITFPRLNLYERDATKDRKMTTTPDGGITETALNPYRVINRDKQKGLVVIEWKKKMWNQNPYEVVVSHYFASLQGNNNTGFSVVARIQGEDGPGALKLEGPDFHPATALFEMFDKVLKSGSWTPNACPHCAACNNNAAASATKQTQATMSPSNGESSKRNQQQVFSPNQSQVTLSQSNNNGDKNKPNQQWFRSLLN